MFNLDAITRPNIRDLQPYSSARSEFTGEAAVFLDANENPFNTPYNRYPDPLQRTIKEQIAGLKHVRPGQIFLGNGSDEPIDLVYRAFCEPGVHHAVAMEPTYGMYGVAAAINNVAYKKVLLREEDFSLDAGKLLEAVDADTRIVFLCTPNNPTGNCIDPASVERILKSFDGLVVVDEAYADFSSGSSWLARLDEFPNLLVLQTFSKAWGLAGIRLGMAFASEDVVALLTKIKYPYNINVLTQRTVHQTLQQVLEDRKEGREDQVQEWVQTLLGERDRMAREWASIGCMEHIYPSEANFILVRTARPQELYDYLVSRGVIVRNRHSVALCRGCLRLTIGSAAENDVLTDALREYTSLYQK